MFKGTLNVSSGSDSSDDLVSFFFLLFFAFLDLFVFAAGFGFGEGFSGVAIDIALEAGVLEKDWDFLDPKVVLDRLED